MPPTETGAERSVLWRSGSRQVPFLKIALPVLGASVARLEMGEFTPLMGS
jgi:hypothetical protein